MKFYLIIESDTQDGPKLMHPSVATSFNKTQKIDTSEDIAELVEELQDGNLFEKVLHKHNRMRFAEDDSILTSKVRIRQICNVFVQIVPIEWD